MNLAETTRIRSILLALTIPSILMFFADAECAQASQKSSDELLLEIMDLHSELVTNETFLAQAKMLGAYLEAAQPLEESKKIKIYAKVLNILAKIKELSAQISPMPPEEAEKSVYEPGAALLEIFKPATKETALEIVQSGSKTEHFPVIRTYWKRDLANMGGFLLPDRLAEIGGKRSDYIAKFSFYYQAKKSGKYGFTVHHDQSNACKLTIGRVEVVNFDRETVCQGVCNLGMGFHRIEFWLLSTAQDETWFGSPTTSSSFEVKVLVPDAFDAIPLTKDMMLLKKE